MRQETYLGQERIVIGKLIVYMLPCGDVSIENEYQRMHISKQEASEILDFMLLYAERFHTAGIVSNGYQESGVRS